MPLDSAAARTLTNAVVSEARQLGVFERVYAHEPKIAPGTGRPSLAFWWDSIDPYARGSGLNAVTSKVTYLARVYRSFIPKDEDDRIDDDVISALNAFSAALSAAFTLVGAVRNVDLLGEDGPGLSAKGGYIEMEGTHFRVAEITVPLIINDMWAEAP